jgi:sulfur transfer complex TusBCD TusB component (DsrH family)
MLDGCREMFKLVQLLTCQPLLASLAPRIDTQPNMSCLHRGVYNLIACIMYASGLRQNTVLVRRPDLQARGPTNTMSNKRVAQLLLLFKGERQNQDQELAYVSWFETKRTADPNSGLYLVGRTKKCSVIDVKDIERGVHLIPKFGAQIGEAVKLQRRLEIKKKW